MRLHKLEGWLETSVKPAFAPPRWPDFFVEIGPRLVLGSGRKHSALPAYFSRLASAAVTPNCSMLNQVRKTRWGSFAQLRPETDVPSC